MPYRHTTPLSNYTALIIPALVAGYSLIAISGCSERPVGAQKRLAVVKVTGTIIYNGQPVEGAHVAFHPTDEKKPGPFAKTDSSGVYTLRTYADGPAGAPEGDYIVTVQKATASAPEETKSGADLFKEMEKQAQSGQHKKDEPPVSFIPEKYAKKKTSDLKATVKSGDANKFDFELKN